MAKTQTILNVRVDLDMLERLDAMAEDRDMNRSDLVRAMLDYCMEAVEQGELEVSVKQASVEPAQRRRS